MILNIALLIFGIPLLYFGGDLLVTGCCRIARRFQLSPFIIGATVIGFGTSSPELAVSILAALKGESEIAMGNVIGSNIANVGLVLGLTALIVPLSIEKRRLRRETPPLLLATLLILMLAWDGNLDRIEGGAMVFLLLVYLWISFRKKEDVEQELEEETRYLADRGPSIQCLLIAVGLALLILGARMLVDGATSLARGIGISEWFIGVSIVALGTSLPEIVSSLMAARRGHGEMSIGNVFGSNIFNILMVLGITAGIHPLEIRERIHPDLLITTGLTLLLLVLIRIEHNLLKRDGWILLFCYLAYVGLKGGGIL